VLTTLSTKTLDRFAHNQLLTIHPVISFSQTIRSLSKAKEASMPVRKTTQTSKASSKSKKTPGASAKSGPVPPYGIAIRGAIARGNVKEMKALTATTRKWLADVNSALAKLESNIKKAGG
jgi:hypothetical protein